MNITLNKKNLPNSDSGVEIILLKNIKNLDKKEKKLFKNINFNKKSFNTHFDIKNSKLYVSCLKLKDENIKVAYEEIKNTLKMIEIQKNANSILIKQRLFFTKKMINCIKPSKSIGTYNAYGQVGK